MQPGQLPNQAQKVMGMGGRVSYTSGRAMGVKPALMDGANRSIIKGEVRSMARSTQELRANLGRGRSPRNTAVFIPGYYGDFPPQIPKSQIPQEKHSNHKI